MQNVIKEQQELNVDLQMKIILFIKLFFLSSNHAANYTNKFKIIFYGLIPQMVEEIHLFQNVIIIVIIFFGSSVLDAEIPQLEIHSLALTP